MTLRIVVCLKQILDPEAPPRDFRIDPAAKRPVQGNTKLVMDSYAANALEVALQLKEKAGGKITVLCVGDKPAEDALRRALAVTADEAVRLWDSAWADLDAPALAHVLAQAIHNLGGADLVLCGRQAGEVGRGMVGPMLAEELGAACNTAIAQVDAGDNRMRLRREVDGGFTLIESRLPAVLTVTNDEKNVPRLPKVKDVMMASRKPITILSSADLHLDAGKLEPRVSLDELFVPSVDTNCEIVEGDNGSAKAVSLTAKLLELKLV